MSKNSAHAGYRPDNGTAFRALEKRLLNSDRQYGQHDWFRWVLEDVLADLTDGRKTDPPPASVIDELRDLSGLYAKSVIEAPPFTDVLRSLYMTLASHGSTKHMGQYFTPAPIAELMARMQNLATAPKPNGGLWGVSDPAVGSGAMLLATARILYERDPESLQWWSFTGIDIDHYCALMCAGQLLANSFVHRCPLGEIVVYRGNSLTRMTEENTAVVLYAAADQERAAIRDPVPAVQSPSPAETALKPDAVLTGFTSDEAPSDTQQGQLQLFFD